jgi:hypothetical protein
VDFANPATFPVDFRDYRPGQSERKDMEYHTFIARVMVERMIKNPDFLKKYGAAYNIDATTLKNLTEADLQTYETYRDKVFVPYLRMTHEAYQNGGEYQPLPFDQWTVVRMLQSPPVGAWIKPDGTVTYGFATEYPVNSEKILKYLGLTDPNNIAEAEREWRKMLVNTTEVPDFETTINGQYIVTPRKDITRMPSEAKFINLGYMEMPGYPNTLILIAGAFDENGDWYLQPFVVNHGRTPLPDGRVWLPTTDGTIWGWLWQYQDPAFYEQISFTNPDEFFQIIGNIVVVRSQTVYIIKGDISLKDLTKGDFENVYQLIVGGLEGVEEVQIIGPAPEYPDLQPVP